MKTSPPLNAPTNKNPLCLGQYYYQPAADEPFTVVNTDEALEDPAAPTTLDRKSALTRLVAWFKILFVGVRFFYTGGGRLSSLLGRISSCE